MAQNIFSINILAVFVPFLSLLTFSHQQQGGNQTAFLKQVSDFHAACIKETGASSELTQKAFMDGKFTEDTKLKCYTKCFLEKMGRMDSNGNLHWTLDHIPPNADKSKIIVGLEKCKTLKGTDACDTAFLAAKCYHEVVGPIHH